MPVRFRFTDVLRQCALLFILFISAICWSQDSLRNKFFVSVAASPDYCFAKFEHDKQYYHFKWGASYNLNVGCKIFKGLSFSIGFAMTNTGFASKNLDSVYFFTEYSYYRLKRDTLMPWGNEQVAYGNAKANFTYKFFGVPVMLFYRLRLRDKLGLNVGLGLETNWLVKAEYTLTSGERQVIQYNFPMSKNGYPLPNGTPTFKPFPYVAGIVRIGIGYDVTQRIRVNIEPGFRYILRAVPFFGTRVNSWSIGVNAGVTYFF